MIEEHYRLHNGQQIDDDRMSEKMYRIAAAKMDMCSQRSITYSWDEAGLSRLFAECYQNELKYCVETKCWYTYNGSVWKKDTGNLRADGKMEEFYQLMCLYIGEIIHDQRREEFAKFIGKMGDPRFRDRVLKDARNKDEVLLHKNQFDAHPNLINCLNGTYDLDELVFREPDLNDYLTMQTNFEYTVQDVSCPRWIKFIDEVTCGDKDKALYLQKALGYSMLGDANEECMFILHGKTTRNGKSTMLNAIENMLGDYASVTPVSIICKADRPKNAEAASPTLAALKGKRFVTMAESNQYGKLDEEMIKQLTGGEEIQARNLFEMPSSFLPQFTLWLSCNDLPSVSDRSLFASDRVRVIEFNRHFKHSEQDRNLKNEFRTQEAMQGIFAWLVEGYFLYKRFGLVMSDDMQAVVDKYERDNDLVLQFLEEKCEQDPDAKTRAKSLYDSYKIWCKSNGYYANSAKRFNADLDAHPEWQGGKVKIMGYPHYIGVKLKGV